MDSKLKPKDQFYDVMTVIGGTLIFAIGVNLFIMPLGFYNGGVLGAAQIIRTLLQRVGMTFGILIGDQCSQPGTGRCCTGERSVWRDHIGGWPRLNAESRRKQRRRGYFRGLSRVKVF